MRIFWHIMYFAQNVSSKPHHVWNYGINRYSTTRQTSADYCVDLVKTHDYENFLCTLLLPNQCRTSAFAVRAFNIEVAKIQDNVNELPIGQMRMKFWEETLDKLYKDDVPKHPVAAELHRAIKRHKLSRRYLKRLITVRASHLLVPTFTSIEDMESYAENSVSSVLYLMLECAGVKNVHADHAASHLGKAQGITNLIRSVPRVVNQKNMPLPQDILLKHSVSHEMVLRGSRDKPLRDAMFDIASRARQHLDKARSLSSNVGKPGHVILLPAITVHSYLEKLRSTDFDVFDGRLQQRNNFLPVMLLWNKIRSRY